MTPPRPTDPVELAINDPELMRIWGELNAEWDNIEHWLYMAFDAMLDDDGFATRAIFYSQRSHAARRDMIEALAKYFFRNDAKSYFPLKNAIKRVKARSDARHELAHGSWTAYLEPNKPVQIGRIPQKPHVLHSLNSMYTKAALKRTANEMKDTAKSLELAVVPLQEGKKTRLLANKQSPTPDVTRGQGRWEPVPKPIS